MTYSSSEVDLSLPTLIYTAIPNPPVPDDEYLLNIFTRNKKGWL